LAAKRCSICEHLQIHDSNQEEIPVGQITHEQANLLLRLYELRREPRLRQARDWVVAQFEANTPKEVLAKYPMGSEENASLRMVLSYWEMAAGLANRGLIDDELFFENSGEAWFVWEKVKNVIESQRIATKNPVYLIHLENLVKRLEKWREQVAPGWLEATRQARAAARSTAKSGN
jgi:hypothetical protein